MTTAMKRRGHVYEADIVRVLTFGCVIAVHTISHTEPGGSVTANGFEMLLHFTREAFFTLTGFVLMYQSLGRAKPLAATAFWRKRIVAVGVPYIAWSIIYTGIQATAGVGTWTSELHHLGSNLLFGQAWYHLYFLLVSIQIYLLFPLIQALMRATAGHHGALLAVSAVVQLAILTGQQYFPPKHGWLLSVANHQDALIVSYMFYVLLGTVAAYHFDEIRTFVHRHPRGLIAAIVAVAIGTEAWYLVATNTGTDPLIASNVLQPVMLLWSIAAVAGLFMVGTRYADHRVADSRGDRALSLASDRSFGVFLVHPLILWLLLQGQVRWLPGLHGLALTLIAYVLVVAGSLAATEVFRRSPLSLPLTGRRVLRPVTTGSHSPAAYGKEVHHATDNPHAPGARHEAASFGPDDGDRHRTPDPLLL